MGGGEYKKSPYTERGKGVCYMRAGLQRASHLIAWGSNLHLSAIGGLCIKKVMNGWLHYQRVVSALHALHHLARATAVQDNCTENDNKKTTNSIHFYRIYFVI